jgi:4-amino-4-deoxy-L-arabinose transferase-like glycosyltransferase
MRTPIDIDFITKAFVGIASPLLGVITSLQEQVEWTLRVASLVVGLVVGIMSLVSMVKKMRRS